MSKAPHVIATKKAPAVPGAKQMAASPASKAGNAPSGVQTGTTKQDPSKFNHELEPIPPPYKMASQAIELEGERLETVITKRYVDMRDAGTVARDGVEVATVCADLSLAAASLVTSGAQPPVFAWNDRYQQLRQSPLSAWQGRDTWAQLDKCTREFQAYSLRFCEEAFAAFRAARKRSRISGATFCYVWTSYTAAQQFIRGFANLSQALFEQAIDGIYVPLSSLVSVSGEYVTCTALPPLRNPQPVILPSSGSVVRHAVERVEAALFLLKSQSLTLARGADGRMYCFDAANAVIVATGPNACVYSDAVRPCFTLKALRNWALFPMDDPEKPGTTLLPGRHVLAAGCRAVANSLVDTAEIQLARAQRDNTAPPTVETLLQADVVTRALRKHGVPVCMLYHVLLQLDHLLRLVHEHPELAKAGRDMKNDVDEQMERMRVQDMNDRRRMEAEDGIRRRKRKGEETAGDVVAARIPESTDYKALRMMEASRVDAGGHTTDGESSAPTPAPSTHIAPPQAWPPKKTPVVPLPVLPPPPAPKPKPTVATGAKVVSSHNFLTGNHKPTPAPAEADGGEAQTAPAKPHERGRWKRIIEAAKADGRWMKLLLTGAVASRLPPRKPQPKLFDIIERAQRQQPRQQKHRRKRTPSLSSPSLSARGRSSRRNRQRSRRTLRNRPALLSWCRQRHTLTWRPPQNCIRQSMSRPCCYVGRACSVKWPCGRSKRCCVPKLLLLSTTTNAFLCSCGISACSISIV
jgi:hypothetical protein